MDFSFSWINLLSLWKLLRKQFRQNRFLTLCLSFLSNMLQGNKTKCYMKNVHNSYNLSCILSTYVHVIQQIVLHSTTMFLRIQYVYFFLYNKQKSVTYGENSMLKDVDITVARWGNKRLNRSVHWLIFIHRYVACQLHNIGECHSQLIFIPIFVSLGIV